MRGYDDYPLAKSNTYVLFIRRQLVLRGEEVTLGVSFNTSFQALESFFIIC